MDGKDSLRIGHEGVELAVRNLTAVLTLTTEDSDVGYLHKYPADTLAYALTTIFAVIKAGVASGNIDEEALLGALRRAGQLTQEAVVGL